MSAARAAIAAYNGKLLTPSDIQDFEWDDWASRLFRYGIYDGYLTNTAYNDLIMSYSRSLKARNRLNPFTRGIYNPVGRQNDLYVSKIYGGALDLEDLSSGPIPVVYTGPKTEGATGVQDSRKVEASPEELAFFAAIRQLWIWSNWRNQKSLYVRKGANLGDAFIKVVDEPDKGRVRMEVLDAAKVAYMETDPVGNVTELRIEYYREDDPANVWSWGDDFSKEWLYTEILTRDTFAAMADGRPYPIFGLANGEMTDQVPNPYGFVPAVHVQHKDMGQGYGANAYYNCVGKIDELNDAASLLNDNVRKSVNVQWFMTGVRAPTSSTNNELTAKVSTTPNSTTSAPITRRDTQDIYYGGDSGTVTAMVYPVDIGNAVMNLKEMIDEIERDMPELSLHRLRDTGNATAPGVAASYSDASDRLTEAMGNYDDGLIRAHQMAVSIGGYRNYAHFEPYNLDSYAQGMTDHYIKIRPIFKQVLSKTERLTALQQAASTNNVGIMRLMLEELDVPADEIQQIIDEGLNNARNVPANAPGQPLDAAQAANDQNMIALHDRLNRLAMGGQPNDNTGAPAPDMIAGNGNQ